jgi:hypothetical protein
MERPLSCQNDRPASPEASYTNLAGEAVIAHISMRCLICTVLEFGFARAWECAGLEMRLARGSHTVAALSLIYGPARFFEVF